MEIFARASEGRRGGNDSSSRLRRLVVVSSHYFRRPRRLIHGHRKSSKSNPSDLPRRHQPRLPPSGKKPPPCLSATATARLSQPPLTRSSEPCSARPTASATSIPSAS